MPRSLGPKGREGRRPEPLPQTRGAESLSLQGAWPAHAHLSAFLPGRARFHSPGGVMEASGGAGGSGGSFLKGEETRAFGGEGCLTKFSSETLAGPPGSAQTGVSSHPGILTPRSVLLTQGRDHLCGHPLRYSPYALHAPRSPCHGTCVSPQCLDCWQEDRVPS